jgi:hypothetical protein
MEVLSAFHTLNPLYSLSNDPILTCYVLKSCDVFITVERNNAIIVISGCYENIWVLFLLNVMKWAISIANY